MNSEEARCILNQLGTQFDSHEFIRVFLLRFPSSYGQLLIKHNNVTTAHAEIANYLRNNSSDLKIHKLRDNVSPDIFGNLSECAEWTKC